MMLSRRSFINGAVSFALGSALNIGTLGQTSPPTDLPAGIGTLPDYEGPLPSLGSLGRVPALQAEVKTANLVLRGVPAPPTTPFEVARYFLDVGSGKVNPNWSAYVNGWPERWNPVIVTFFEATDTRPEGDLTPWCAAFVNWCFLQAIGSTATHSASSGSFRDFGNATMRPVPGDIVVFNSANSGVARQGHGHVGFFMAEARETVEVLGGNQVEGRVIHHAICREDIRKAGSNLVLHSYRTYQK